MTDKPLIIDASVAIKWFLNEDGTNEALAILDQISLIFAPEIFEIEIAAILTKRVRMRDLVIEEAQTIKSYFDDLPIIRVEYDRIKDMAFLMASEFNITLYDAIYLATAIAFRGELITADTKLFNGLQNTPFKNFVAQLKY